MGKNKHEDDGLTKAERKALEQREAALIAELEARVVKSKSKTKAAAGPDLTTLKRKALKTLLADKTNGKPFRKTVKAELARRDALTLGTPQPGGSEDVLAKPKTKAAKVKPDPADDIPVKPSKGVKSAKAVVAEAAEGVLAGTSTPDAIAAAETALEAANEAGEDETTEQIKARVKAKREARAAEAAAKGEPYPNPNLTAPGSARGDDALEGESEVDYQWRKARESEAARAAAKGTAPEPVGDEVEDGERAALDAAKTKGKAKAEPVAQVVETVETETGRVFEAGVVPHPADERGFALPSEGGRPDFEVNGNGQYKIKRLSDGKIVGYTRATTYIGTNEDRTLLERWKLRILLEGVAINDEPDERGRVDEPVVAKVRELIHVRDLAIAKARKQDGKGKLVPGQYGTIVDAAWSAFKRELDALGESLLELGGVHVKAAKGTELHELTELYDREGIDAVGELLTAGAITHADMLDVEAYARAIEAAGIKMLLIEQPIVVEDLKVAGRLDRVVMCKLPGAARAAKYILDTKTGRIDLGAGKIAQQLEMYSRGETYDLETHERGTHGASRTKGLVLHLVPGSAEAHIYVVDLSTGRVGNELSAKVRAYRNDGKRAIDLTNDLANPQAASA